MPKKKRRLPKKSQSERFIETARKLSADESGAAFGRAMDLLVPKSERQKPKN